jgi:hypothetical protein
MPRLVVEMNRVSPAVVFNGDHSPKLLVAQIHVPHWKNALASVLASSSVVLCISFSCCPAWFIHSCCWCGDLVCSFVFSCYRGCIDWFVRCADDWILQKSGGKVQNLKMSHETCRSKILVFPITWSLWLLRWQPSPAWYARWWVRSGTKPT